MRVEEVLGPRGELNDLASPARRHTRVCILSPDAVRGSFSLVNIITDPIISALFVDEEHFSDAALRISIQLRALHLVLYGSQLPIHKLGE